MGEYKVLDPEKQKRLRAVIERLHGGASVAEVKKEFAAIIKGASAADIAAMEQALVDSGFPVEEIQRLCEVHVQVFETSLEKGARPRTVEGHPIHSYMAENRLAVKKAKALRRAAAAWAFTKARSGAEAAKGALEDLTPIVVHYTRKENQLFPWLEKHGFTGPSRVMWGKHDDIRAFFKEAGAALASEDARAFKVKARALQAAIRRMVFMEEHILFPESERRLSALDWAAIRQGEAAIGWAWIQPGAEYDAWAVFQAEGRAKAATEAPAQAGIELNTGRISAEVLDLALRNLPVDVSVIDEHDKVLYYSDSPERIFPRSPGAIGRDVHNCHPQKSVAMVEKILQAFKDRTKDRAVFWIPMGERFVVIEYRALYDAAGRYRGCLEVSQDAAPLRAMEGQKRLLDWD